jgi:hypothetical protein
MRRSPVIPLVLVVAALLCGPSAAVAQDVSVPALKAAFLSNFVKFTDWPEDQRAPGRVFTFCVSGDKAVSAALQQSLTDHPGAAPMSVIVVTPDGPLRSCQMLYVGGMDLQQARRAIDALKGAAVFTVSDIEGFAEAGGVAQFRLEKGRMRFAINPGAAQRAHLTLSAKLLSLATIVKEGPE